MATPLHHLEWIYIRAVLFRLASIIAVCSGIANILPNERILAKRPLAQSVYEVAIFIIATLSLNWRARLPSLHAEFLGFRADEHTRTLAQVKARWQRRRDRKRAR
jgi:hypothetical protein